jgi:ABC-type multidrug transport system permease subunit
MTAFRPEDEMTGYMWVMFVTGAVFSFFFTFIFAKGYEGKGVAEGFRYGIYIGLFYGYVTAFDQFVVYPIPYSLAWIWAITGIVQTIVLGIVAALIYKPKRTPLSVAAG